MTEETASPTVAQADPTLKTDEGATAAPGLTTLDLDLSPSHLLHRAQQIVSDLYLAEFGASSLTQRQIAVLNAIARQDKATQTDLVASTGIDRSTLAEMVARMEAKGLTVRTKSPTDNRANAVSLTEDGIKALQSALPMFATLDERLLDLLPQNRRDAFVDLLRRLALPKATGQDDKKNKAGTKAGKKKKKGAKKKKQKKAG
jgi:MarR family transcriptional regulator, temperature-dependent positive regulator of motility